MSELDEPIQHREDADGGAFFVEHDGKRIAELTYSASGTEVVVGHTWVEPEHRGTKLAPSLVDAVADWARKGSRRIVPVCSYVRAVFERSGQYDDVWKK